MNLLVRPSVRLIVTQDLRRSISLFSDFCIKLGNHRVRNVTESVFWQNVHDGSGDSPKKSPKKAKTNEVYELLLKVLSTFAFFLNLNVNVLMA